jgi:hypothetical protein
MIFPVSEMCCLCQIATLESDAEAKLYVFVEECSSYSYVLVEVHTKGKSEV